MNAPTPTPSRQSSSFDSELTLNDDPMNAMDNDDFNWESDRRPQTKPWYDADGPLMRRVKDLLVNPMRHGWCTRKIMDETLGASFVDAENWIVNFIAVAVQSWGGFKVGITCDPNYRWHRDERGHCYRYFGMHLLYVHPHAKPTIPSSAGAMERQLIARCSEMQWPLHNIAPGGEGAPQQPPCFVYVAWAG